MRELPSHLGVPGWLERLYLPGILGGLRRSLGRLLSRPLTTGYLGPEGAEKRAWPLQVARAYLPYNPRWRGGHLLKLDERGRVKCVACLLCAAACPSRCIRVVPGPSPWAERERYPVAFEIDTLRCIHCGLCEEACPCDALELTPRPGTVRGERAGYLRDKEALAGGYPQDWRTRFARGEGKHTGAAFTGEGGERSLVR